MEILVVILIIVGSARLGGELMERLSLPGLLGELLVGVLLGFLLLTVPGKTIEILKIQEDPFFRGLLDVAIFFLMFMAGLEIRLRGRHKAGSGREGYWGSGGGVSFCWRRKAMTAARSPGLSSPEKIIFVALAKAFGLVSQASRFS